MSDGERLKNAISEPLANAEAPISIMVSIIEKTTPNVGVMKCTSENDSNRKLI